MKRFTFICMLVILIPVIGFSQSQQVYDDIYFKPSDAKLIQQQTVAKKTPNYKNGAKEIIYIDRKNGNPDIVQRDTVEILAQANDSTENQLNDSTDNGQENGYYLNGFNGNESDLEYAERIRRFHDPKYEIFIGDPRYNDIYFLNNSDWNVYVDGSYAYVTPTWTNPYWWNYNMSPFSYWNSWYSPYSYNDYWYNPWGYYSGFGFGGYYGFGGGFGYGYPYYGYGYGGYGYGGYGYGYGGYGYGGYGGYPYYGYGYTNLYHKNPNHDEATRRDVSNYNASGNRIGGTATASTSSRINSGYNTNSSRNPYTVVTGGGTRNENTTVYSSNGSRTIRNSVNQNTYTGRTNGVGLVRSGFVRPNSTNGNTFSRSINTTPRTTMNNSSNSNSTMVRPSGNQQSSGNNYRSTYNSGSSRSNYNNGSNYRSSPSYSSGSPSRSSSSYSGGSSSGTRSSSSSSSSSSSYSGGGGGGGSRSSGSSSGSSRR